MPDSSLFVRVEMVQGPDPLIFSVVDGWDERLGESLASGVVSEFLQLNKINFIKTVGSLFSEFLDP